MQNSAFEMVRKGAVFLAEEGTLYLHEVAELTLEMQAQLVRYLESGVFTPVGSNDVIASSVRLVCSTSANLMALVEAGRFRNDLFHMLNQMVINTPTLNERIADIDILSANILREIAPGQPYQLDRSAYNRLLSHSFTGNLIELRNILLRAISQSTNYVISENVMQFAITGGSVFSQNQDLQERTLSIESTMQQGAADPLSLDGSTHEADTFEQARSLSTSNSAPVVEPGEINDTQRRGRWAAAQTANVDTQTLGSKLEELSVTQQSLKDISTADTAGTPNQGPTLGSSVASTQPSAQRVASESLSLKERELLYIEELLVRFGGDKKAVADELGCTLRTLYRKIEKIKARSK
jgi:DNA-binding NtrC family response regulator